MYKLRLSTIGHLSGGHIPFVSMDGRNKRETIATSTLGNGKLFFSFHLHVVHEQWMVSSGRDNPDFDSVLRVPVQELVIDEDLYITNVNCYLEHCQ